MLNPTRPQIREALRTLVADKRYRDFNHPEHDAYVAHVTGEFKRVYPGKYEPGSSHVYANDPEGGPEAIVHVRAYSQSRSGNVVEVSDYDRAAPGKGGTDISSSDRAKIIERAKEWQNTPYAAKDNPLPRNQAGRSPAGRRAGLARSHVHRSRKWKGV